MRGYFNSNPVGCSLAVLAVLLICLFNISQASAQIPAMGSCSKISGTTYSNPSISWSNCKAATAARDTNPAWGLMAACPTTNGWVSVAAGAIAGFGYGGYRIMNVCGGTSAVGTWKVNAACPDGTNPIDGNCPEVLQCDIDAALSLYPGDVFTETLTRPQTVENGSSSSSFCSSNCEVQHITTITTVAPEYSNSLYVTQSDSYDVVALDCTTIDPDSSNYTASIYPAYIPADEQPDQIDTPDDPDGPDTADDPDAPTSSDPPVSAPPTGFCDLYPTHTSCTNPTGGGGGSGAVCGGPGLPACNVKLYNNTGVSSAFCTTMPTGGGDQLLTALLIQEWRSMCATEKAGREIEQEIKAGVASLDGTMRELLEGDDPGETVLTGGDLGEIPDYQAELDAANDERDVQLADAVAGNGLFDFTADFSPITGMFSSFIPSSTACGPVAIDMYALQIEGSTCGTAMSITRTILGWSFFMATLLGIYLISTKTNEVR